MCVSVLSECSESGPPSLSGEGEGSGDLGSSSGLTAMMFPEVPDRLGSQSGRQFFTLTTTR